MSTERVHHHNDLIYLAGTQIVASVEVTSPEGRTLHPRGAVGVVVRSPVDRNHAYRVRFPDGVEASLKHGELMSLAKFKEGVISDDTISASHNDLCQRVIYCCVIGSQAYGLAGEESDVDRRGIYLPPAELQWSLYGVPEQLENHETQEAYWEMQKFLIMALKSNPNVLECLYSPLIEFKTPLAEELLEMRSQFLSKLVYQTYNGYVMSQFKKMQTDIRNQGQIKWKHVMHLIRLLISGITILREGIVPVRIDEHREQLLAIKRGEIAWDETEKVRLALHGQFANAFENTKLPERPNYERANEFLIDARRKSDFGTTTMTIDARLFKQVQEHPYPLVFATISGAHLYGFPSADSDYDLRGIHLLPIGEVAGLKSTRETVEKSGIHDGLEVDLVTHDAKKFFSLMLKKNGYVLEQLLSPLVVHTTPEHEELKAISEKCVTKHHAHHYLGFADTQWKLFTKDNPPNVKPLLYVYRVLLTGIHLMCAGQVEANLVRLNDEARLSYVTELIERKLAGAEKGSLSNADVVFYQAEFERLKSELLSAFEDSRLPEQASGLDALHDLLVRLRTRGLR